MPFGWNNDSRTDKTNARSLSSRKALAFIVSVSTLVFLLFLFLSSLLYGERPPPRIIAPVVVRNCVDGDTCRIDLPRQAFRAEWAYRLFGQNIPLRLAGIDTPELRGHCQEERDLAVQARDFVRQRLATAQSMTVALVDDPKKTRGKYFRIVGQLRVDGRDLSTLLLDQHLAVPYDGMTKMVDWCADHERLEP